MRAGEASIVAGTWSINQVFSDRPAAGDGLFMVSGFGPGRFVNIEASATSAANLEWYVREFVERETHHDDPFGFCNARIADVTPSADDPYFHPFLYGSVQGASFRSGFYGLAGWHGEGHMLRALFEGVLFEHRRHVEVLKSAGLAIDQAVLSGGGSRSPFWPQMFADCLGVPIAVAKAKETGALGAAIGVAVATGAVASYEDGVARMTRRKSTFEPTSAMKDHYDARYERYLALIEAMRGFWDTIPVVVARS
ncbi:MAG: FGGY-family carbohydrate kinase [Rhodospirillaceae bacterium]|nr:FGGY-family carbohydrate kinase [Rhodospirillaceae bacterium]